jgi:hypothetical protein
MTIANSPPRTVEQPGYLAANIHRSLDGTKVTNYAHWRSPQDFQALARNPDAVAHMRRPGLGDLRARLLRGRLYPPRLKNTRLIHRPERSQTELLGAC